MDFILTRKVNKKSRLEYCKHFLCFCVFFYVDLVPVCCILIDSSTKKERRNTARGALNRQQTDKREQTDNRQTRESRQESRE